jgi:large subunit ribosomal protein L22
MGRAFRYVRRISHIELVLAERGKSGENLASRLGDERSAPAKARSKAKAGTRAKTKARAKAPARKRKKTAGAR